MTFYPGAPKLMIRPFQDVQVGEIGDAIDRLGEIALQIGEKADKQAELVAGLHQQVSR